MKLKPILAIALLAALPAGFSYAQSSPAAAAKTSPAAAAKTSPAAAAKTSPAATTETSPATAATAPATSASPARSDIYHVHFTHAAPGKASALGDSLKEPDPTAPMPGHSVVLRHQDGDSWDYVAIEHMGPKATLEAARPVPASSAAARDLSDWHTDTYVSGPAWADFAKALGINEGAGKSAVYVVSIYRTVPGHREQLDAMISSPSAGDPAAGSVVLQHLEGADWTFMSVVRYATWDDFVKSKTSAAADQAKGGGNWARVREHFSFHTDTLADRILP